MTELPVANLSSMSQHLIPSNNMQIMITVMGEFHNILINNEEGIEPVEIIEMLANNSDGKTLILTELTAETPGWTTKNLKAITDRFNQYDSKIEYIGLDYRPELWKWSNDSDYLTVTTGENKNIFTNKLKYSELIEHLQEISRVIFDRFGQSNVSDYINECWKKYNIVTNDTISYLSSQPQDKYVEMNDMLRQKLMELQVLSFDIYALIAVYEIAQTAIPEQKISNIIIIVGDSHAYNIRNFLSKGKDTKNLTKSDNIQLAIPGRTQDGKFKAILKRKKFTFYESTPRPSQVDMVLSEGGLLQGLGLRFKYNNLFS